MDNISWMTVLVFGTIFLVVLTVILVVRSIKSQYTGQKLIPVYYADFQLTYVTPDTLDDLIAKHDIVKFKRTDGWVTLGVDQVRESKREHTTLMGIYLATVRTIKSIFP
jgi:hypothetical protein